MNIFFSLGKWDCIWEACWSYNFALLVLASLRPSASESRRCNPTATASARGADITSAYLRPMMESMGIKYRPKVSTGLVVWDTDTVGRWLVLAHIRGWYLPRDSKDCPLLLMKGWEWRIRLRWAMMSVEIRNCISYKYLAKDRMMLTLSFITHVLVLVWTRY